MKEEEKGKYLERIIEALNERALGDFMIVPTFDESPYHEIKVLIPRDIEDDVYNIDVNIYFKEKASDCKKKFTDREGVHYITGLKQEGSKNVEQED